MCDADRPVSSGLKRGVTGSISLKGSPMPMEFPTVELRGNALLRPECIHLKSQGRRVEGRDRQVVVCAKGCECILERRAGDRCGDRLDEQSADWLESTPAAATLANAFNQLQLEEVEAIGFLPG